MKKLFAILSLITLLVGCSGTRNIMSDYQGFNKKDHHYVTKNYNQIIDDITSYKQGVYYIGYAQCPWCVELVPVMEEVATAQSMNVIYLNAQDKDFKKDKAANQKLNDFIKTFPQENQNKESVPFTISIGADKTIKTHLGTAPNHKPQVAKMSDDEIKFVKARLTILFENAK